MSQIYKTKKKIADDANVDVLSDGELSCLRTKADEGTLTASRGSIPSAVPSIKTRRRFGHGESSPCPTFGRVVLSDRTC